MDRLCSRFPGGAFGFGLLLLRLIAAAWFLNTGIPMFGASSLAFFFALVLMSSALLLIAGLGTWVNAGVGIAYALGSLLLGNNRDQWFFLVSLAALSGALLLLGPGGYSVDARLSGWRTIDLSSKPPSERLP